MDINVPHSLCRSFELHLRAENRAPNTIAGYLESIRQAEAFLALRGRTLLDADRGDLEAFMAELLARRSASTAATRYKGLRVLYAWLEEEEEIPSPMSRRRPPIVREQPVPVVPDDSLRRLLATCAGKDFDAPRDTPLTMYFLDTGARRGEAAALQLSDLDFDYQVSTVLGKGRRTRDLPFGRKTALALDRYLRARALHRQSELPWLWLGQRGQLDASPLRRLGCRRAGAKRIAASHQGPPLTASTTSVLGRYGGCRKPMTTADRRACLFISVGSSQEQSESPPMGDACSRLKS
jgi:site-specific recombinase XerD